MYQGYDGLQEDQVSRGRGDGYKGLYLCLLGIAWFGLVLLGFAWFGLVRLAFACFCLFLFVFSWFGLQNPASGSNHTLGPVLYTHLTLPTKRIV